MPDEHSIVGSLALKALIQQIPSGLYWKSGGGWIKEREQAETFGSSNAAILFCLATQMRDTGIVISFGDPKLDVLLHPFGERGHEPTSQELIEQSRAMKERSQNLVGRVKVALASVLQTIAAIKERKKLTKFERKKLNEEDS